VSLAAAQLEVYDEHVRCNNEIRTHYHDLIDNLPLKTTMMVRDFKENIRVSLRLDQGVSSFYTNEQVSVLTFVVSVNANGKTRKVVVTFVSKILNHDALSLRDCLYKLSNMHFLRVIYLFILLPSPHLNFFPFFFLAVKTGLLVILAHNMANLINIFRKV
jgi:hypothetical protein